MKEDACAYIAHIVISLPLVAQLELDVNTLRSKDYTTTIFNVDYRTFKFIFFGLFSMKLF